MSSFQEKPEEMAAADRIWDSRDGGLQADLQSGHRQREERDKDRKQHHSIDHCCTGHRIKKKGGVSPVLAQAVSCPPTSADSGRSR